MSALAFDNIWASRLFSLISVMEAVFTFIGWLYYDQYGRNTPNRRLRFWRIILIVSCLVLDLFVLAMLWGTQILCYSYYLLKFATVKNHHRVVILLQILVSIATQEREVKLLPKDP